MERLLRTVYKKRSELPTKPQLPKRKKKEPVIADAPPLVEPVIPGPKPKPDNIDEREKKFKLDVMTYKDQYPLEMLGKFTNYWVERNPSNTKMKWEIELKKKGTFEIGKRLATWASNNFEGGNHGSGTTQRPSTGNESKYASRS